VPAARDGNGQRNGLKSNIKNDRSARQFSAEPLVFGRERGEWRLRPAGAERAETATDTPIKKRRWTIEVCFN